MPMSSYRWHEGAAAQGWRKPANWALLSQYRQTGRRQYLCDSSSGSLRVRAPGYMPGQLDCLQLHASCTRDSLLRAAGTLRRQPWNNLIGTKEPHHLFETEYWLSKGFDGRDTNALSDSVELKPGARNLVPRPMFSSRPPPVSSQVQDSD
ncbi:hypothetical protein CABS01_08446 [Colletotrichum abscissum]|uniref:uncharacterized protein n=1 Tax=Colletotrichum abscissum TaxID=1671311 RepID=UPI0027D5285D|nr:uncharacterized protein CABS01_08446 [Colletotrichum abscissum]KAK1507266.1 hypothetical protein CABS01_08446 [Colletotrichum abscissum]